MKIKRFKNLWTMGLILFGSILVFFYVAKLFFPQFIVGVAELPSIVRFGNFVDTHIWAYHLYNILVGFLSAHIISCASCRKKFLNWKESLVVLSFMIALRFISILIPTQYDAMNYVIMYLIPFVLCLIDKNVNSKTFISTSICFCVDIVSQVLSIQIRNLVPLSAKLNIATITILLIDGWIWRALLYFFFNNENTIERNEKQDGN